METIITMETIEEVSTSKEETTSESSSNSEIKDLVILDPNDTDEQQKKQIEDELKRQGYNDVVVSKKMDYDEMNDEDYYYNKTLKTNLEECALTLESLGKKKRMLEYELSLIKKVKGNNRVIYNKIYVNLTPLKKNIQNYKLYQTFYKKLKKVLDKERSGKNK